MPEARRYDVRALSEIGDRYSFSTDDLQRAIEFKAQLEEDLGLQADVTCDGKLIKWIRKG